MKLLYGTVVLAWAPFVGAGNDAVCPTAKVAAFVFDKVDVTSLPSAIRPKPVKGKKTFSDYGSVARELDEKNARLNPPQGAPKISIEVLEAQRSRIYACVSGQPTNKNTARFQRVFVLKLTGNGLLRGKTWKEFDAGDWRPRSGFSELEPLEAGVSG
jgi:hypothetical protein